MSFEFPPPAGGGAPVLGLVADRRLYLTADESRAVEEGSADARFLFATPGTVIPQTDCDRLGLTLVDGKLQLGGAAPDNPEEDDTDDEAPTRGRRGRGRPPRAKDA